MLQHDMTNNKYYHDGVEITETEYNALWQEWHDNLPPTPPVDPDPDIDEVELAAILLGEDER